MKKILLIPLMVVMLVGVIAIVNAKQYAPVCDWKTNSSANPANPTANGATVRTAAQDFTVDWGTYNDGNGSNITQVAVEYRITSGTWYTLGNVTVTYSEANLTNATVQNTTFPGTTPTGFCFDGKTYELRATLYNSTGDKPCASNPSTLTGIICDNTKPQCDIKLPVSSTTYTTGQTVIADAANSTSCQWDIGRNWAGTVNGTVGIEDCTYAFSAGDPPETIYQTVSLSTRDQTGNTTTCTATNVKFDDDEPNALRPAVAASLLAGNGLLGGLLPDGIPSWAFAAAIVIVIIAIAKRKK